MPGFNKDIYTTLLYENYAKVQQRQYEHFMPGFNKDGTNICARVQQRRHEHFIQGSTKTVRTFCARVQQRRHEHLCQGSTNIATVVYYCMKVMPGFNKEGTNILCQGSTKTVRTFCARVQQRRYVHFVPGFNKDSMYICARVQQR